MEKQLTVTDGTHLAYDVHGDSNKPILVMIHGVTDSKETYDTDLEVFEKYFQVYRYDLRGHGHSSHPTEQFTLKDHIQDAVDFIKKLDLNDIILYGGSLGSYIAQGTALAIPKRIKKLVLNVSASHNPASALAETSKKDKIPEEPAQRRSYWIKHLTYDKKNIEKLEKSGFQKHALNKEDEYRALKSITAFDFSGQLDKITCPTLITSGIYDPVNPASPKGEALHRAIKNSKFVTFNSGHLLRLEIPEQYHKTFLDFATD